jgi:nucleotide-binding universal stress UspA family protein
MNDSRAATPVVVGIDGSTTAIGAAQWAIEEAISRNVPLRLVCVTKSRHPSTDDYYQDIHHAEESLRTAQAAVEATGKPVKVETAILDGPPGAALVAESADAEMVCVGSVGIGQYA